MKILALETSTETASVALLDGDRLLERSVAGRPGHSETILPEIRLLLAEAGVALDALDAIAFGAFEDYRMGGVTLSAKAIAVLKRRLAGETVGQEDSGMSKGEWREFTEIWG